MRKSREQKILDIMFEVVSRVHANKDVPKDREEVMEWARHQLNLMGFNVIPMGLSHGVIRSSPDSIDYMTVKELQSIKDAIADVVCWHNGFEASGKEHISPPGIPDLIDFGNRLQQQINRLILEQRN